MMRARVDLNNDRVMANVRAAAWAGILAATVFFWGKLQEALNIPNPGEPRRRKRDTVAGPKGSTYTVYPSPSKPGDPPRKRTGWLAAHVQYEAALELLRTRVGLVANAIYGLYLDLGTIKMEARPWLLATLQRFHEPIVLHAVSAAQAAANTSGAGQGGKP